MSENKQDRAKKIALLDSKPALVVFSELVNIIDSLDNLNTDLKEAINQSKTNEITVNNPEDMKVDLSGLESKFEALNGSLQQVLTAIEDNKKEDIDISINLV